MSNNRINNLEKILHAIADEINAVDNIEEKTLEDYDELSMLHKMKSKLFKIIYTRGI